MHRQLVARTTEKIEKKAIFSKMLTDLKKEIVDEQVGNKNILIELLTIKIFHSDKFKELTGGVSSNTYYYAKANLVLRYPKPHNPLYRHTDIEIHNLSEARLFELTPLKIVGHYTKYSLLVTEFIPSFQAYTEKDFKQTDKLIALSHLIKKLHYSKASFKKNPETSLCFIDSSTKTFQTIKSILSEEDDKILQQLDAIRYCLTKFNIKKRPAHGDFHQFNLIRINGKMQLLDWELSSLEDPALDISRFFCVSNFDNTQKSIFLQFYQSALDIPLSETDITSLTTRVKLFEPLNYFSIVVWAKYAILFSYGNKKSILEATIKDFTEKSLNTIEKIDLATISHKNNVEDNPTYSNNYFSLFRPSSENAPPKEQEKKLFKHRLMTIFKFESARLSSKIGQCNFNFKKAAYKAVVCCAYCRLNHRDLQQKFSRSNS